MSKFTEQIKYNHMKWQPNVEHCGVSMSKQYIAATNCYNYRQDRQTVRSQHTGYGTKLNKVSLQKELSQLQIIEWYHTMETFVLQAKYKGHLEVTKHGKFLMTSETLSGL